MRSFRRASHQVVGRLLHALDCRLLLSAECYFGGGTQLALTYGEYRESRDVDFLCSSRAGFRKLRECVAQDSLGAIARRPLQLAREVRADREGIRTFVDFDGTRIKFEILLEGRLDLTGALDRTLGIPVLSVNDAVAEKFLANTDRGLDESTLGRDLIDLAFLATNLGKKALHPGLARAESVYGTAVRRYLDLSLAAFQRNRSRSTAWIEALRISDTQALRKGLRVLRALL
jgi:nucleotidyltransferase AbiEii toxin of type IV toxin-antitoxin system